MLYKYVVVNQHFYCVSGHYFIIMPMSRLRVICESKIKVVLTPKWHFSVFISPWILANVDAIRLAKLLSFVSKINKFFDQIRVGLVSNEELGDRFHLSKL